MIFAIASRTAGSEPGRVGSQWSAMAAVLERRGSMTMSLAPWILPSMILWACGLK